MSGGRPGRAFVRSVLGAIAATLLLAFAAGAEPAVYVARIDGSINPASADYLMSTIERAETAGAEAVLIELDTPGGLVSATQDVIQAMLNASVPTIVFVTPRGAGAISAGTFITLAANVAVMQPGTTIGAAHPVSLFGGESPPAQEPPAGGESEATRSGRSVVDQKTENYLAAYVESIAKQRKRNVEWAEQAVRHSVAVSAEEALELGVIDLIAKDRSALVDAVSGRSIEVASGERILDLAGVRFVEVEMSLVQKVMNFVSDPNVATILFAIMALGFYMEFQTPGLGVPGAIGLVAMILLGFALQILPISWVGVLLVLVGVGLLIAELFVTSFGLLFAAGMLCFLVGGNMVFDRPEVSDLNVDFFSVLLPMAIAMSVFGGVIAYSLGRTLFARQTAGVDEMIGLVGRCEAAIDPTGTKRGKVFVRGEYWNGVADEAIAAGEPVEIVEIQGLTLRVRKAHRAG
ncbi:MAG: nodulation protein NfeD [Spirochaetaceae bacterium]|nr:nodulation protein NfeD [Myxococcales bacterium]MCB9722910.1 nodulation protein NfeD [Spirochaetaceae bacterium]HPG25158.1 nodulation protein NfeD [Myxococcota bacterium]